MAGILGPVLYGPSNPIVILKSQITFYFLLLSITFYYFLLSDCVPGPSPQDWMQTVESFA